MRGPVLALTATATKRTETSLRSTLDIPEEGAFRDDAIRANLTLSAMRVPASAREATLKHLLQREPMRGVGSAIVYVAFQNQAETVAAYLQTNGVNAKAYHAGQEPKDRQRTQAQFFAGSVRVVVATVAFGMGLDKDVRAVINSALPRSPEAYIQQAGRAGRDGLPARCVSFIDADDFTRLRSLSFSDGVDRATVHKLLETVFLGRDRKARSALAALAPGGGGAGEPRDAEGGPEKFGRDSNPNANENRDSGNEVAEPTAVGALIVQQLEREMDMRGEVIETVLSCLELWDARVVERRCAEASEKETKNKKRDASRATLAATETASSACPAKNSENGDDDFGARGDGNGLVIMPGYARRASCRSTARPGGAGRRARSSPPCSRWAPPKAGPTASWRRRRGCAPASRRWARSSRRSAPTATPHTASATARWGTRSCARRRRTYARWRRRRRAPRRGALRRAQAGRVRRAERAANAEDDHAQSARCADAGGVLVWHRAIRGDAVWRRPLGRHRRRRARGLAADVRELLTHAAAARRAAPVHVRARGGARPTRAGVARVPRGGVAPQGEGREPLGEALQGGLRRHRACRLRGAPRHARRRPEEETTVKVKRRERRVKRVVYVDRLYDDGIA